MFYAHFVLSKKGPLAKIWLAAHWDKKLTKAHVFETSIEGSVEAIIQPKAKIALRTSGHLLLGVVRIYSRKAKYLLADCNEAFVKIKMAFRPGMVDLPEENREAAVSAITLPETFHDFDTAMAELGELEVPTQFAMNQSRPEEITMKEDLGSITMINDDGFGDMGFDGGLLDDSQLDDSLLFSKEATDFATLAMMAMKENKDRKVDDHFKDKDEGGKLDEEMKDSADSFAVGAATAGGEDNDDLDDYAGPAGVGDDDDYDSNDGGRDSPAGDAELFSDNTVGHEGGLFEDPMPMPNEDTQDKINTPRNKDMLKNFEAFSPSIQPATPATANNLLLDASIPHLEQQNPIIDYPLASPMQPTPHEPETFILKPVDTLSNAGYENRKYRKKRKLVVDEMKAIASETMKLQLSDTSDIVTSLDLAPPTKKLMLWKETGGVEKLTAQPGRPLVSKRLIKIISANLILQQAVDKMHNIDALTDHRPLHNHNEELEVRSKIGADGSPRLVFALKKKSQASPNISSPKDVVINNGNDSLNDSSIRNKYNSVHNTTTNHIKHDKQDDKFNDDQHINQQTADEKWFEATNKLKDFKTNHNKNNSIDPVDSKPLTDSNHLINNYNNDDDDDNGDAYGNDDAYDDDDDDYVSHNKSVEPEVAEEEEEEEEDDMIEATGDEGFEELEEKRWTKRSSQMLSNLNKLLTKQEHVSFKDTIARCTRKQVSSKFYSLLVLKKTQTIDVHQQQPYADIILTKGLHYTTA